MNTQRSVTKGYADRKVDIEEGVKPRIRVLMLEDNEHELRGVGDELETEPDIEWQGGTEDPEKLLELVRERQPHVVIIDLQIYDDFLTGWRALRDIKRFSPQTKCLVLTNHRELQHTYPPLSSGAEAIAWKAVRPGTQPSLPELIRMVHKGQGYIPIELLRDLAAFADLTRLPMETDPARHRPCPLGNRELEAISYFLRGYNKSQIASAMFIGEEGVDTHLRHIREKLAVSSTREAALMVRYYGWLHDDGSSKRTRNKPLIEG